MANYDAIAATHVAAGARNGSNPWQPAECVLAANAVTAGALRKYVEPGARILDVGCGPGDFLNTMADYQRFGVDISNLYIKLIAEKGIDGTVAWSEDLPFADGEFDAVVCADVLEHVLDLHKTISEALRVLRPGGYLVIRVPQEDDLAPYLKSSYEYVHLRRFDVATLQLIFGRIFQGMTTIVLMFEMSVTAAGTLAKEIICVARRSE